MTRLSFDSCKNGYIERSAECRSSSGSDCVGIAQVENSRQLNIHQGVAAWGALASRSTVWGILREGLLSCPLPDRPQILHPFTDNLTKTQLPILVTASHLFLNLVYCVYSHIFFVYRQWYFNSFIEMFIYILYLKSIGTT